MLEMNNRVSLTEVTSAAETLRELLDEHNITQTEFAQRIGITNKHLSNLLHRKAFMSPRIALRIEKVTGIDAGFLLQLDINYLLLEEKKNLQNEQQHHDTYLKRFDWV